MQRKTGQMAQFATISRLLRIAVEDISLSLVVVVPLGYYRGLEKKTSRYFDLVEKDGALPSPATIKIFTMYQYKALKIDGKRIDEHRYLVEKVIGRKLKRNEVVHHKDGNKRNNDLLNLEILSLSEHSSMHVKEQMKNPDYINELRKKVKKRAVTVYKKNVLNRDQVGEIKSLKGLMKQVDIAKRFNVSKTTISRIFSGEMWGV